MRLRLYGRAVLVQRLRRRRQPPLQATARRSRRPTRSGNRWTRARRRSAAATSTTASSRHTATIASLQQGPLGFRHPAQLHLQLDVGAAVRQGHCTGLVHGLAAGWQLSGIFTAHSGMPLTPVLGFDRARALPRSGGAGQWPDLVVRLLVESSARRSESVVRRQLFRAAGGRHDRQPRTEHRHRPGLRDAGRRALQERRARGIAASAAARSKDSTSRTT